MLPELMKRKTGPKEKNIDLLNSILATITKAEGHAKGFHKEIQLLTVQAEYVRLYERKTAAVKYFADLVLAPLIASIEAHITSLGTLTKVAKQVRSWKEMNGYLKQKEKEIKEA